MNRNGPAVGIFILPLCLSLCWVGCKSKPQPAKSIDVPSLMNKQPAEVSQLLGSPTKTGSDDPSLKTVHYLVNGNEITVSFDEKYGGTSQIVDVALKTPQESAVDALLVCGIDVHGVAPDQVSMDNSAQTWHNLRLS